MERDKEYQKQIDPKYIAMVVRFNEVPKDRNNNIKRIKMILKFRNWYRWHRDILTKNEREYLQANISRVDDEDVEGEATQQAPWE